MNRSYRDEAQQQTHEGIMETNGHGWGQRRNATHVVDAELEHLEWATRQPMLQRLNACYWRRRVLEVKCGYQLTRQQDVRIEKMLRQLAERQGANAA
jgi:hypothetical protein